MLLLSAILCFLVLFSTVNSEESTVFGKLKSGFNKLAGRILGVDHANGVAQLVSEAFGKTHRKGDNGGANNGNIFSSFLRVLGFEPKKIGAIAVNAIIFVAQLISSSLTRPAIEEARSYREGTPFDWMMSSAPVMRMIPHITDKELPHNIVMYIKERSLDEETDCVQLLICKISPFIWGMQKLLNENVTVSNVQGKNSLYAYLPSLNEVSDYGEVCDKKHKYCLFEDF